MPHIVWLLTHQRIYSKIPVINFNNQFRIGNTFSSVTLSTGWPTLSLWLWNISISAIAVYLLKYSFPLVSILLFSSHYLTSLYRLSFWAPYLFLFLRFYFLMLLLFIYQKNIYKVFTMCIIVWKFLRDSKVHMTKALFRRLWLLLVKRDVSQSFQLDNTSASPPLSTFFLSKLTDPQDFFRSTSWPTLALLIYSWISSSLLDLSLWIYYRHLNFNVSHIKFSLYQCSFHLPKDHCLSTGFLVLNVAICSNTRPVS